MPKNSWSIGTKASNALARTLKPSIPQRTYNQISGSSFATSIPSNRAHACPTGAFLTWNRSSASTEDLEPLQILNSISDSTLTGAKRLRKTSLKSAVFNSIGLYFFRNSKFEEAEKYFTEGLNCLNLLRIIGPIAINLANIAHRKLDDVQAKKLYELAGNRLYRTGNKAQYY